MWREKKGGGKKEKGGARWFRRWGVSIILLPLFLHHINFPFRYHHRHCPVCGDDWSFLPFPLSTISVSTSLLWRLAIPSLSWGF